MSSSARKPRRNAPKSAFFTRKLMFAAAFVMVSAIATLAAFGPQAISLQRLLTPFVGASVAPQQSFNEVEHELHAEPPAPLALPSGTLATARSGHTATLLADGKVLIVGGSGDTSAEVFDPTDGTAVATGNTNYARTGHTATRLSDGRILIAGGGNTASEIYNPATQTFELGPLMTATRSGHTATAVGSNVVITGGGSATVEVFNGTAFTNAGTLIADRTNHSAALMNDGRVFIAGGTGSDTAEIYNPADGTSVATGNPLAHARAKAHLRVLPDGKVQIIGGNDDVSMEVYDASIDTVGAHVHLLPDTDTCTGLRSGVRDSPTRAALFFAGNADAAYDRTGHTITEVSGNQALVIGGTSASGASNAVTSFASSPATITTDKLDYAPGETVTFNGTGFSAGETVRVVIHEDPHTHLERNFEALADASGNISGSYLVEEHDLNVKFIVNARGLTSNLTAQTAFTDANPQSVAVAAPTSATVVQGSTASYGDVTVTMGGNNTACTMTFGTSGLPTGATAVFGGANPLTVNSSANVTKTLNVSTTASTTTGSHTFTVTVARGLNCQGSGNLTSNSLTLIVNAGTVNTTTAVTNATATYGDASVTLNATVTPATGPAVGNGSVTFTVKQGATTIGAATTDNTVVAGAASVSYALPAGTDAGPYTIEASYTAGTGFNPSSGTATLTIGKRNIEVTATAGQFKIYDKDPANPASYAYTVTNGSLVSPDAFTGALARVAGENVGLYAINIGTLAINDTNGGNNYNLSFVANTFEIKKRDIEVTATAGQFKIYDKDPANPTSYAYTVTSGSLVSPDAFTGALARVAGENVGLYAINLGTIAINDGNAGNNYNLSFVGADFEIKKRDIEVTAAAGQFKIYDKDPANPTSYGYTVTNGSLVSPDAFTGGLARAVGENVGLYPINIGSLAINDGNSGGNYNLTFTGADFEIKKRDIQVTATAGQFKIYDKDPANPATYAYTVTSGSLVLPDAFTGGLARAAGENVGLYPINIGSLAINDGNSGGNYNLSFVGADFEIKKRDIQVTATAGQFKIYDKDPANPASYAYTITNGSLVLPDAFTGALSRVAGENVGLYAINIGTLAISDGNSGGNYNLSFVGADFEIKKRDIEVTATAGQFKIYDKDPANPASYAYTVTNGSLISPDAFTGGLTRVAGENVGLYAINLGTLAINDGNAGGNYNLTFVSNDFEIKKRNIEVTATAGQFKIYGDPDPAAYAYTVTSGSLISPDAFTGALTRVAGENAGLYAITIGTLAINDGNVGGNYNLAFVSNNFEIKKRLATWTTNPNSKTYGDPDPAPLTTGSGSNFVAADNVTATYGRVAGENASPPTYHISATLSATPLSALDNYIITNDGAEFTINKRLATWTTNPNSKTYGDPDPVPLTTGSGSNFVAADNVTASYSRVAGENASPPTYHITATLSATPLAALDNYIITNDGAEFTINKRLATWTTDPNSKTYGDLDPVPLTTGVGTNFVAADTVTATYTRVAGEAASPPTYHITATLSATPLSALDNYVITNEGAEFTIDKRLATWTTNPASKTYGDPDPVPVTTGSGSNFVDPVTATYARVAGENASPPTYHITATLSADPGVLDNYDITNTGAEFTINKRLATWTTNPSSKTYGDPDPVPVTTGSGSNFVDPVTATYARVAGENASPPTYHITATLSADPGVLDNYDITNTGAEFTINKRLATWTTNAASKTYGEADPSPLTAGSGSNFIASDNVTATYSRVAGESASPPTYHITATLSATGDLNNYTITNNGAEFTINKLTITVTPNSGQFKSFGQPDPVFTYSFSPNPLPFSDSFTGALSRDAGEFVGLYNITQGTLSLNPNNYNLVFTTGVKFEIKTIYCFNGFHSPVGGSVESGNGGSFVDPVKSFKLNSTIPFKFTLYNVGCSGSPITTGIHTIQLQKFSNQTDPMEPAIDATPTDAATTGNQFRLTGTDWHFNLDTKRTPSISSGTWLVTATLFDGSKKTVWISIKK